LDCVNAEQAIARVDDGVEGDVTDCAAFGVVVCQLIFGEGWIGEDQCFACAGWDCGPAVVGGAEE
jgi:hypothetical protein